MDEAIDLSIVIVNSDGRADTIACLESIRRNPPECVYEIVLVDNCSAEEITDFETRFERVRVLSAPEKQSFAKNYNLGLSSSRGRTLVILNNDTLVQQRSFEPLIQRLDQREYAFVGPYIVSVNGRAQTNCARNFVTPLKWILNQSVLHPRMPLGWLLDRLQSWRIARMGTTTVQAISGTCMAARRDTLERIGLLDEAYPLYFEEDEWCHRAHERGYKMGFVKEAVIVHLGDRSIGKVREWSRQSEYLSALKYFRDYYALSPLTAWAIWAATLVGYVQRWAGFRFVDRRRDDAAVYMRLIGWLWRKPPTMVMDHV